jgi:hypothetical protein
MSATPCPIGAPRRPTTPARRLALAAEVGRPVGFLLALAALLLLLFPAPAAEAQARDGRVRLGAGLRGFSLALFTDQDDDIAEIAAGATTLSPGLEIGVQLDDLLLGSRAILQVVKPAGTSDAGFELLLLPHLQYLFGRGKQRPFFGAQLGGGVVEPVGGETQGQLVFGLLGGLHAFVAGAFAISPWVELNYVRRFNPGENIFQLAFNVSFSGWL